MSLKIYFIQKIIFLIYLIQWNYLIMIRIKKNLIQKFRIVESLNLQIKNQFLVW